MIFCVVIELTFSYLQIILPSKSVWIIFFGTAQFTFFLLSWDWTFSLSQGVFHSSGVHKVRKQVRRKRAKYLASLSVHILWVAPYRDICPLFSLIKTWNWTKETHPKRPCKNKIWIYQTGCDFCYFLNLLCPFKKSILLYFSMVVDMFFKDWEELLLILSQIEKQKITLKYCKKIPKKSMRNGLKRLSLKKLYIKNIFKH